MKVARKGRYLVGFHDGIGLKVGRLLHEAAHQQHGFAFGLQAARVRQGLIVRETLGHALLQDNQGLVDITLITEQQRGVYKCRSAFDCLLTAAICRIAQIKNNQWKT